MKFPIKPTAGMAQNAKLPPGHTDEGTSCTAQRFALSQAGLAVDRNPSRAARPLKARAEAAFTFAEVLAAMVFMAIAIPVTMQGIQIANRAGVVAARKTIAIQLADKQLNEAVLMSTTRSSGQSGTFPEPYKEYRWRQTEKKWTEDATMREISVEVFYMVQNQEYSVFLATLLPQETQ